MKSVTPEQIDALLPQTQCGLCGYGGCMPYAEAMIFDQEKINLCPPGGIDILNKLGQLLGVDPAPFHAAMEKKAKSPALAVIREAECIGCTKCIHACPVDAILGSSKQMHTIISDECTGCELCIPPCPVDCIDLIPAAEIKIEKSNLARKRFQAREVRITKEKLAKNIVKQTLSKSAKTSYIEAAIARVNAKRGQK